MNISLQNKTAVVCGSTQGIGLAIAEALAEQGATCILFARNEESLKTALTKLSTQHDQEHSYRVADFSDPEQVRTAIQDVVEKTAAHILINNTGGPAAGAIVDAKEQAFKDAFEQHLICNHILVQATVPGMKQEKYGRIINILSTSIKTPLRNLGVSGATRAAVASWAKVLSFELGQFNITVNNLLPGAIDTKRIESLIKHNADRRKTDTETIRNEMLSEIPMQRFGEPSEIAAVAAFLASPAASYVSGVSIPVDGGKTISFS